MSTAILPTLAGLGWSVHRGVQFSTRKQVSLSGKMTTIAEWQFPIYSWTLLYNVLRLGSTPPGGPFTEFSDLLGFFNLRQGGFDSFLYKDPDDHSMAAQPTGVGDGANTTFPLIRSFGGNVERVLAMDLVNTYTVFDNGTPLTPVTDFTITPWESTDAAGPGIIKFVVAPVTGHAITVTGQFYWPCRFVDDSLDFEKFMDGRYKLGKLGFISVK